MTEIRLNAASIYNALSKREVALFAEWERARQGFVTSDEMRDRFADQARGLTRALVRKKVLERLDKDLFRIRPFRQLARPTRIAAPAMAALLLRKEPYCLSGLWALSFHGLSSQRFGALLDFFVARRRPTKVFGTAKFIFHLVPAGRLTWGIVETSVDAVQVKVSDPERTVIDLLDYPQLAGKMSAALRFVEEALPQVNRKRLVAHAVLGARVSSCQRLGLLLERAGASAASLHSLKKKARSKRSLLSLVADGPRIGPVNKRWNVVENDQ